MLVISPLLLHISPTTKIIITMSNAFFLLLSLLVVPQVASFLSTVNTIHSRPLPTQPSTTALFSAMERLHDKSTNAFGRIEHVYSLNDIDDITRKIAEDEWMAGLGTAIAEAMYEMILDVSDEAMHEMGFVERMSVTNKIADDVTSAVEVSSQYNVIMRSTHSGSVRSLTISHLCRKHLTKYVHSQFLTAHIHFLKNF